MKKNLIRQFLIAFSLLGWSSVSAQQSIFQPNVNVPSPNASSLGQYGEVPVSMFTGVPNINVPVYTVQEGSYKLPLSLSYHYSGVRPNVCPGSAGANWTLVAGGAITRIIKGMADEGNSPGLNLPVKNYGYLFNTQVSAAGGYEQSQALATSGSFANYLGSDATFLNGAGSVLYDLDPDEFDFNVCGLSGSFYLNQAGAMQVKCNHDVTVTYNSGLLTPFIVSYLNKNNITGEPGMYIDYTFSTFTITDEDGTQYIFGETTTGSNGVPSEAVEYSTGWADNSFRATSWYLTTILLTNGKKISFTYDRGPFTTQIDKSFNLVTGGNGNNCPPLTNTPGSMIAPSTTVNSGLTYSAAIISPLYLRNISTTSGTSVNLNYAASNAKYYQPADYLNVLQLIDQWTNTTLYPMSGQNGSSDPRNYVFAATVYHFIDPVHAPNYCDFGVPYYTANPGTYNVTPISMYNGSAATNYFTRLFVWLKLTGITVTDNFDNVPIKNFGLVYDETGMLKLTQLQNMDSQGNLVNQYTFAYNTRLMTLPPILDDKTDYWGYFNDNNQTYTTSNFSPSLLYANKATNIPGRQSLLGEEAEILRVITYPTGGSTTFQPDNNYFGMVIARNNPNNQYDSLGYCGGVRIKRITNLDAQGNVLTSKTYYYLHGYQNGVDTTTLTPSGELAALPTYTYHSPAMPSTTGATVQFAQVNMQPIMPMSLNSSGSHIGYSEVAEVNADGGYTIYKYTNYSDGTAYQDSPPDMSVNANSYSNQLYPLPNNDNSEMRGHLKSIAQFNSGNQPVSLKTYSEFEKVYTRSNINIHTITGGELFESCGLLCVLGGTNTYDLGTLVPTYETDLLYNPDGSYVQNNITSIYNITFKKVSEEASTASDGTPVTTTYTYPFNYTDPISTAMTANNIVSPVIIETTQKSSVNVKLVQDVYQQFASNANPGINLYLPASTQIQIGANPIETRQNYLAYDPWGNLASEAKPGGPISSYQWGYDHQFPVVAIQNAANTLNTLTTTTTNTGTGSTSVTLPSTGGTATYTTSFTVTGTAATTLNLAFSSNPNSSNNPYAIVNCTITGTPAAGGSYTSPNIQLYIYAGTSQYSGGVSSQTVNLAPGQYTLSAVYSSESNLTCNVYVEATYPTSTTTTNTATTGVQEFYFESFEEDGTGTAGTAHTGNKSYAGTTYTVNWTVPNTRSYVISYWYLNAAGIWTYQPEAAYTGPSKVLSVTGATAYDDIRIYPVDALMTTYTYNPLTGMTSVTDPKGMTTYYEYDTDQRLMNIKDLNGNIIKHFDYHYAAQ